MKNVIAIDGPSASGKGTLARTLAQHLNFAYLDTGAVYRAVSLYYLAHFGTQIDEQNAQAAATYIRDHFQMSLLNDPALRTEDVAQMTSKLSSLPPVRAILLELQRDFAKTPPKPKLGAVLDGRDIGTVVCPDARLKLFVTASPEVRAQRRTKELQNKGISTSYEAVLHDMVERDVRDKTRNIAPTIPAKDAIILDTSLMNADEVLKRALDLAANAGIFIA